MNSPRPWSLHGNPVLRVIPRSPPLLLADDDPSPEGFGPASRSVRAGRPQGEESRSEYFQGSRSCPSAGWHPETMKMPEVTPLRCDPRLHNLLPRMSFTP